jgi:hypothetical protein
VVLFLGLDLLGLNRGETPRLWIFLMLLLPIAAAPLLRHPATVTAVTGALLLQAIVLVASVQLI